MPRQVSLEQLRLLPGRPDAPAIMDASRPVAGRPLEVAQAKAERIISEELRQLGWQESDLALRRRRDPSKVEIAVRLRKETTLSVKQVAARPHLGTWGSASLGLLEAMRKTRPPSTWRSIRGVFGQRN